MKDEIQEQKEINVKGGGGFAKLESIRRRELDLEEREIMGERKG